MKLFAETAYGSIRAFAQEMKVKSPTLYPYFRDEKEPGTPVLLRYAYAGGNINWLLIEEGDMFADNGKGRELRSRFLSKSSKEDLDDYQARVDRYRTERMERLLVETGKPSKNSVDPADWIFFVALIKRAFFQDGPAQGNLRAACTEVGKLLPTDKQEICDYYYTALISEELNEWGYWVSDYRIESWDSQLDNLRWMQKKKESETLPN